MRYQVWIHGVWGWVPLADPHDTPEAAMAAAEQATRLTGHQALVFEYVEQISLCE
jgi:hypothetical protein